IHQSFENIQKWGKDQWWIHRPATLGSCPGSPVAIHRTIVNEQHRKGLNSLKILIAWELWKHPMRVTAVLQSIADKAALWCTARAKGLSLACGTYFVIVFQAVLNGLSHQVQS
ncbi:hypothetical protein U9M48_030796, partial [Paspalum notatum var. saurae]